MTEDQNDGLETDPPSDSTLWHLLPFHDVDEGNKQPRVSWFDYDPPEWWTRWSWRYMADAYMREEGRRKAGKNKFAHIGGILDLPLDLMYEIFGLLHPLDLYHISQTTKSLRNLVLTRDALALWKTVYERHPDIPRCPRNMSEPAWTAFIFIPTLCEGCGKYRPLTDFALRRCLCETCLDVHYVSKYLNPQQGQDQLYPADHVIWELLPYSSRGYPWIKRTTEVMRHRYSACDLRAMAETIEKFESEIASGRLSAREAFEDFKRTTKEVVSYWVEHTFKCAEWGNASYEKFFKEREDRYRDLANRIVNRFIRLGYHASDIQDDCFVFVVQQCKVRRLTRRAWREIRPYLEAKAIKLRDVRRLAERQALLKKRAEIVKDAYLEYKKTISPITWKYLPHKSEILALEMFSDIINLPTESEVTVATCGSTFKQLPGYLADRRERQRRQLLSLLPLDEHGDTSVLDDSDSGLTRRLELALSVFTCIDCMGTEDMNWSICFGWEDIIEHNWCPVNNTACTRWTFSSIGSSIAANLARLVGLDPSTASARDMDRVDARFMCAECPVETYRGVKGQMAVTWRECVIHAIDMQLDFTLHEVAFVHSGWHLLTPETTTLVKLHEEKYPNPAEWAWSCNHCAVHFDEFVRRKDALDHIIDVHSIETPRENIDFFYHHAAAQNLRRPVGLSQAPPAEYRCNRCPNLGYRLFTRKRLEQHLRDKHGIKAPVINEDCVKVAHVLRTSRAGINAA
ncbi:hypothetical protein Hypma_005620 [Hypsizygus marmoreus]|uniref:F-box domain-containing protein n=1 Tax=Hypsizygus marmoreus TaxID=39966 RepID=A0A369JVX6_HYPMA|nr:hypothetical protein Hypma_005620 [Hypsizygus marmoreus]